MILNKSLHSQTFRLWEIIVIVGSCFFPLLLDLPYRVNIFLSWEGAYRLYLGQVPYKDFGMPLGIGFFLLPAIFFKIFGPSLFTLVKTQVLINLISLFSFSGILKKLGVTASVRFLSIFVFCLSYTFFNFWPWYNQSVFVFELLGVYFILAALFGVDGKYGVLKILAASFCMTLSFFTKQDAGAIAIVMGGGILLYIAILEKNFKYLLCYIFFVTFFLALFIVPFLSYDFGYWFNYGQAPHSSRLKIMEFMNKFFGGSPWEKFYLFVIALLVIRKSENIKDFIRDKREIIFLILTIGVIGEALIIKVTSPLPTDHQSYFHGFAFAYMCSFFDTKRALEKIKYAFTSMVFILLWWSAQYWDYAGRIFKWPASLSSTTLAAIPPLTPWVLSDLQTFAHIKMPASTIEGIKKLKQMNLTKKKNLQVLNMSELTPLAEELHYMPLSNQPLWYHLNIGMFPKQVEEFCEKIKSKKYDLILYQEIPVLPTFYPQEIKPCMLDAYRCVDKFEAPRKRTEGDSYIYVYVKK